MIWKSFSSSHSRPIYFVVFTIFYLPFFDKKGALGRGILLRAHQTIIGMKSMNYSDFML